MSDTNSSKQAKDSAGHNYVLDENQLGIWRLITARESGVGFVEEIRAALPLIVRLTREMHAKVPDLFFSFAVCQLWESVHHVFEIYLSSLLLRQIESAIFSKDSDGSGVIWTLANRLVFVLLSSCITWWLSNSMPIQENKIRTLLHLEIMKNNLEMDMPTSQSAGQQRLTADEIWSAVKDILAFIVEAFSVTTQTLLLFRLSREAGGTVFALLSMATPLLGITGRDSFFRKAFLLYVNNEDYKRMRSLEQLSDGSFRQDVISYRLTDWILKRYLTAFNSLGNTSTAKPWGQRKHHTTPSMEIFEGILGEIPMIYCALQIMIDPKRFSLASIAILQQSSDQLRTACLRLLYSVTRLRSGIATVRRMETNKVESVLKDGIVEYLPNGPDDQRHAKGMAFQLRDVCFSYPGSEKMSPALSNINLHIEPESIVVIVGENGSGKSTLIRILSRLYDPSSGMVVIDGRPSKEYRISDLHQASAILSQDSLIYPLSLAENIGLGHAESVDDTALIEEAAQEGGAAGLIGKLEKGYETFLDPYTEVIDGLRRSGSKDHPLKTMAAQLKKKPDLSGGEKQRIVAARTFMRFKSGKVNFVAVDEPSSALDAQGEYNLFQKLLENREGKTMVFVTHRFGHLTKVADHIICLKDGSVAEAGSHADLMTKDGEYAKLYNIQAQAYRD